MRIFKNEQNSKLILLYQKAQSAKFTSYFTIAHKKENQSRDKEYNVHRTLFNLNGLEFNLRCVHQITSYV